MEIIFTSIFFIILFSGIIGTFFKFYLHLSSLLATPLYASLIFIELFLSGFGAIRLNKLFKFNITKDGYWKIFSDLFAFICTCIGINYISNILNNDVSHIFLKVPIFNAISSFELYLFLFSIFLVKTVNFFSEDNGEDPFTKLKKLGVPNFIDNTIKTIS